MPATSPTRLTGVPRYPSTTPTLFIIGGAEDRVGKAALLRQFVRLAGGRRSRLVLVPTASSFQDEVIASYTEVLDRLGAARVDVVNPSSREDAHDPRSISLSTTPRVSSSAGGASCGSPSSSPALRWATRCTGRTTEGPWSPAPRRGRRSCPTS